MTKIHSNTLLENEATGSKIFVFNHFFFFDFQLNHFFFSLVISYWKCKKIHGFIHLFLMTTTKMLTMTNTKMLVIRTDMNVNWDR